VQRCQQAVQIKGVHTSPHGSNQCNQWARIRRSAQTKSNALQEQCIPPCAKSETLPESAWQTPYARGIERTARAHHHRSARAPRRYLDGRDDVEVCASDHRHPVDRRDDVTRAQPSTSSQRPLLHRHNSRTVAKGATSDERDADPLVVLQNEERGCGGCDCWCACSNVGSRLCQWPDAVDVASRL
jgi:hypothetical protein